MKHSRPVHLKWGWGVVVCVGAATLLSVVMNDADVRLGAPFICIFVVIFAAFQWGRLSAILGTIAASVTFLLPVISAVRQYQSERPDRKKNACSVPTGCHLPVILVTANPSSQVQGVNASYFRCFRNSCPIPVSPVDGPIITVEIRR